jgi:hypothetical protein
MANFNSKDWSNKSFHFFGKGANTLPLNNPATSATAINILLSFHKPFKKPATSSNKEPLKHNPPATF